MSFAKNQKFFLAILIQLVLSNCSGQPIFTDWRYEIQDEKVYKFDPEQVFLLAEKDEIEKQSFIEIPLNKYNGESEEKNNFSWRQYNYFYIAQTFLNLFIQETSDDLQLYEVYFKTSCTDFPEQKKEQLSYYWDLGEFSFYSTDRESAEGVPFRVVSKVLVDLHTGLLIYAEHDYYPVPDKEEIILPKWDSINLSEQMVNAEDALTQLRSETTVGGPECRITLLNSTIDQYDGWYIILLTQNEPRYFVVNDRTGVIENVEK